MNETTQAQYSTLPTLYIALELSNRKWKLGFTVGLGQRPRVRSVDAGDLLALEEAITAQELARPVPRAQVKGLGLHV